MSHDPRVLRLSTAIAEVLVALVEIANAERPERHEPPNAPEPQGVEPEKAQRVARQRKSDSAKETPSSASAEPEPSPEIEPTSDSESEGSAEEPAFTLLQAKDLTLKVVSTCGKPAAVALLEKYKAVKDGKPNAQHLAAKDIEAYCVEALGLIDDAAGD